MLAPKFDIQKKPSVCPLDCPDTCSLTVTVESEKVTAVRGSRVNPITSGAVLLKSSEILSGIRAWNRSN